MRGEEGGTRCIYNSREVGRGREERLRKRWEAEGGGREAVGSVGEGRAVGSGAGGGGAML